MKGIQLLCHLRNKKLLVYHYLFSFSCELKCEQGTGEPTLTKQTINKTLEEVDIRAIGQRKQCSWPFPWRELPTSPETEMSFLLACLLVFFSLFFYHNLVRTPTNLQTQMSRGTTKSIKINELSRWGLPKFGEQRLSYLKEQP